MYRQYAAYKAMLHIKQRMSVGIIAKYYTQYKIWQHLRTKDTIPALPLEIWCTIFSWMDRMFAVPHRRLFKHLSFRYPSRLPGPTCGICDNEAFIPVCLRFDWSDCYDDDGNIRQSRLQFAWNGISQEVLFSNGFCTNADNMYCLRCARDHTKRSEVEATGHLMCPHGCCNSRKPFPYRPYMAYGDWPRLPAAVAHYELYHEMDRQGVGQTTCPLCSEDCGSILAAIDHVRTVCRRS